MHFANKISQFFVCMTAIRNVNKCKKITSEIVKLMVIFLYLL